MKLFSGFLIRAFFCIVAAISMQPAAAHVNNTPVFEPNIPVEVYDPNSPTNAPADGKGQLSEQYAIIADFKQGNSSRKRMTVADFVSRTNSNDMNAALAQVSFQSAQPIPIAEQNAETRHTVHPKPIVDNLLEQEPLTNKILLLSVKFTDNSGRVISLQQFREVPAGIWQQHIALNSLGLKAGMYFIYIDGLPETGL
jgi:hypothetical protein